MVDHFYDHKENLAFSLLPDIQIVCNRREDLDRIYAVSAIIKIKGLTAVQRGVLHHAL